MSDEEGGSSTIHNAEQFAFLARMENIKVFSLLLKAISFKVKLLGLHGENEGLFPPPQGHQLQGKASWPAWRTSRSSPSSSRPSALGTAFCLTLGTERTSPSSSRPSASRYSLLAHMVN